MDDLLSWYTCDFRGGNLRVLVPIYRDVETRTVVGRLVTPFPSHWILRGSPGDWRIFGPDRSRRRTLSVWVDETSTCHLPPVNTHGILTPRKDPKSTRRYMVWQSESFLNRVSWKFPGQCITTPTFLIKINRLGSGIEVKYVFEFYQ